MATRWTIRHGFMLLWFKDLMNVTKEVTTYRPNVLTLLPSAFIRGWSKRCNILHLWRGIQFLCLIWCVSISFCGFFFPSFGDPAKERCRRYPETVISVITFIVGFTVFCLFDFVLFCFVFKVTPACALTYAVYKNVILFLLPNKRHRQDK